MSASTSLATPRLMLTVLAIESSATIAAHRALPIICNRLSTDSRG
jgi:hypothetical protein